MEPSLLVAPAAPDAGNAGNAALGASVNLPNPLQIASSMPPGDALVGHELDSLSTSDTFSNQRSSSSDQQ